jgi:uncharacterized cupin superfamily protein
MWQSRMGSDLIAPNKGTPMTLLQSITQSAADPVESRPDPSKVIAGDPVFTSWDIEDRDGIYAGIWQATPGCWKVSYDEWEYCRILAGHSILRGDDGSEKSVKAGDSFIIRPGFSGTWEVVETTVKDYVIKV